MSVWLCVVVSLIARIVILLGLDHREDESPYRVTVYLVLVTPINKVTFCHFRLLYLNPLCSETLSALVIVVTSTHLHFLPPPVPAPAPPLSPTRTSIELNPPTPPSPSRSQ